MRVFKTKAFSRFARKEGIEDNLLWEVVERAEQGNIDADLGGGVIKQRIPRLGEGRDHVVFERLCCFVQDTDLFLYMVLPNMRKKTFNRMNTKSSKKWLTRCFRIQMKKYRKQSNGER